jgi:hypothetical protein
MERIVALTFAGRKKYMEILFSYIDKYRDYIDEYRIYIATEKDEDIQYIIDFHSRNQDFVKLIRLEDDLIFNRALVWNIAYRECQEEDAIYVKIDDDIVYIDENLFTKFIDFRKKSSAPLVYPHIINNMVSSPLLQKAGTLKLQSNWDHQGMVVETWKDTINRIAGKIEDLRGNIPIDYVVTNLLSQNEILCPVTWGDANYSKECHLEFIEMVKSKRINNLYTGDITLLNYEPMSIQCCSWFGRDLKKWISDFGMVGKEDEPWLAVYLPVWLNSPNSIFGNAVVSHFSSYVQESNLIESNILEEYKKIL